MLPVYTTAVLAALSFAGTGALAAGPACSGAGATPAGSPIACLGAIYIPGNPITSFDISFVNPVRAEYYLADRANATVDIIQTSTNTYKGSIPGFAGCVLAATGNTCVTSKSGPNGLVAHGRWLYAGDGNSTLKVLDLQAAGTPADPQIKQTIATGGTLRVDEMAIDGPGVMLLTANNADDPPFATLFTANGDNATSNTTIKAKITVDTSLIPAGFGLSLEQPAWDPVSQRFYVSVPQINYPAGCVPFDATNPCQGGLLVIDPKGVGTGTTNYGPFNGAVNAGLLALPTCGPNGATIGPPLDLLGPNVLLGCTPANIPSNTGTVAYNTTNHNYTTIANITGSDEVWFNSGDNHYYTASNRNRADQGGPSLGIIDATGNILIGRIPQGDQSHSVAADSLRNLIYVPQAAPKNVNGGPGQGGGDTTSIGQQICGDVRGCVAVYIDVNPTID
jgi:hypothetical protein